MLLARKRQTEVVESRATHRSGERSSIGTERGGVVKILKSACPDRHRNAGEVVRAGDRNGQRVLVRERAVSIDDTVVFDQLSTQAENEPLNGGASRPGSSQ